MSKKKISIIPVHPDYSHEELLKITAGYDTLVQLKKEHPDLYKFIKSNHLSKVYGAHMQVSNKKYNDEYLESKCKEYSDQIELRKQNRRLYYYLVNNNLLKKYFTKNVTVKFTKEAIQKLISKSKTVAEFRRCHQEHTLQLKTKVF